MSYSQGDEIEHGVSSSCCGASVYQGLCGDCFEHCDSVDDEDEDE